MLIHLHALAGESSGWHLPPLHPILVNFTAALIPVSVLSDVLGRWLKRDSFHQAAWWMLLYAAVVTPLTATAGWWWMRQMQGMDDWRLPVHMWLGFSMTAVVIVLAFWRFSFHQTGRAPGAAYLLVAFLSVAALAVQGELGGQMSFGSMVSDDEAPHPSKISPHKPMPHEAVPPRSGSTGTQPATQPDDHPHEHPVPPGTLQWRDHIDLNG